MPQSDQKSNSTAHGEKIVVILAGGAGRRMGGGDKGEIELNGRRLVDWAIARLKPQTDQLLISGAHHYETGLAFFADREGGPAGPAAGLWAAMIYIASKFPAARGFVTVPVDGPFAPKDLVSKLLLPGGCAVACDEHSRHPTFAYWEIETLKSVLQSHAAGKGVALRAIADECQAQDVFFTPPSSLMNINAPTDLEQAEKIASTME